MSDFGNSDLSNDQFLNTHERETNGDNFSRGKSSTLQATAPEYHLPNRNLEGVRKKTYKPNREFHGAEEFNSRAGAERNIDYSNLKPNAQEFYPSNNSGAVKKRYDKNWKDKNKYTNWRSSGPTYDENVKYDSQRFYRPKNSKYVLNGVSNNVDQNYKGHSYANSKQYEQNHEPFARPFDNTTGSSVSSKNPRHSHINVNQNYKRHHNTNTHFHYEQNYDESHETTTSSSSSGPSKNSRYSYSNMGHNNKGHYNNTNNYDHYGQNHFETNPGGSGIVSSAQYERSLNENASNEYRNKPQYDRRNGYGNKLYTHVNKHKQHERNQYNSDNNFLDRPIYTEKYEASTRKNDKYKLYQNKPKKNVSTAGQRETLTEVIDSNLLECMVCCEKIKRTDKIWTCCQCYHIVHLNCIAAWAKSSKVEDNWRCPACQNIYDKVPHEYKCYCGKVKDPKLNPNIIAHGCDNMCLKPGKHCDHKCSILCHPGPCPECNVMVSKPCGCGLTKQVVKCCSDIKIVCDSTCNKVLNCGLHTCAATCHVETCFSCAELIIQECHCGKTSRRVSCDAEHVGKTTFTCDNNCDKLLPCGIHKCEKQCHSGPCNPCEADVTLIRNCYCGKTPLEAPRLSCLDPIPCCEKICSKSLICGPPSRPHMCKEKCHKGKCPPCPLTTVIRCRCGHMDKEIACQKLTSKADDARCEKKCTKKRLCGKHTCKQKCCIEIEHVCPLPCNKVLTCGLHKCELTCHSGRCPPCMDTSFEELYCECGASVLYPPVPCGTRPPACEKPCSKPRSCGHPPNHDCHPGSCPPCFVLTKRWCFGKHEQRAAIPCQQKSFSCGLPCGKPMPCGRHKCNKPCHEDACPVPCAQQCTVPRLLCGHSCNQPCHDPPCPGSNCKQMVPVTCSCGLQKTSRICLDLSDEYKNIEMAQLKSKMGNLSCNQSVDVTEVTVKKPSILKILECNDECKIVERNRRLAIGLQIQNPDISQKLTPKYSDFLRQWAKKDSKFCQRVHDRLSELVQLAKQSKQKSRSYSFESMNRDKRHFIHEYCEYFGVESAAYDAEPNRNVVATATKDKSWLPGMSLLEVLQRENGQRKVPGPILGNSSKHESETVSLRLLTSVKKN